MRIKSWDPQRAKGGKRVRKSGDAPKWLPLRRDFDIGGIRGGVGTSSPSSRIPSRWNSMASRMLRSTSSRVRPVETHPGRSENRPITLCWFPQRRSGISSFLDPPLFNNAIECSRSDLVVAVPPERLRAPSSSGACTDGDCHVSLQGTTRLAPTCGPHHGLSPEENIESTSRVVKAEPGHSGVYILSGGPCQGG
jgi:hypothetical protein